MFFASTPITEGGTQRPFSDAKVAFSNSHSKVEPRNAEQANGMSLGRGPSFVVPHEIGKQSRQRAYHCASKALSKEDLVATGPPGEERDDG